MSALRAGEPDVVARRGTPRAGAAGGGQTARGEAAARAVLAGYVPAADAWAWASDGAGWRGTVETATLAQRVLVRVCRDHVRFTAQLGCFRDLQPVSRRALRHFLLALNARLRLARAALVGARVSLEVVLAASDLDERMIERAFGALAAGAAVAKRECTVLAEPGLAAQYCAFHDMPELEDGR